MVFFSWAPPTPKEQKACIDRSGGFNYEAKLRGATAKSLSSLQEDKSLLENGFLCNHARVLVGSGLDTYEKGKKAMQDWRHFGLNWAFVDPKTPVKNGEKFCVCVKEFVPWVMMPLQIVYVNENKRSKNSMASFRFGGGTLQGHLLAGEERFSIEMDENNQVWYEILSFSKPAHILSFVGYPYVMLRQSLFSTENVNHMQQSQMDMTADWSNLPGELWPLIGKKLKLHVEFLRFRSVCPSWRSSLPPPFLPSPPSKFPLPHSDGSPSSYLSRTTLYLLRPSATSSFTGVLLVKVEEDCDRMFLRHPVPSPQTVSAPRVST